MSTLIIPSENCVKIESRIEFLCRFLDSILPQCVKLVMQTDNRVVVQQEKGETGQNKME